MKSTRSGGAACRAILAIAASFVAAIAFAFPAAGQESWDAMEAGVTRDALQTLLGRYELAAESPAYTPELRAEARAQAATIRSRLAEGDFRPGDRLVISVEEHQQLTDTFAVTPDRTVVLPGSGAVELEGVLRSELLPTVTSAVARVIREPRVRTHSLVRVQIDGAVGAPGFYLLDSNLPVSDVLMRAGGQAQNARVADARVERAGSTLISSERLQDAMRSGATVDHLGLRDGDRVFIPAGRSTWLTVARDLVYIVPAAAGFIALLL